jgi:hypothetical protein
VRKPVIDRIGHAQRGEYWARGTATQPYLGYARR